MVQDTCQRSVVSNPETVTQLSSTNDANLFPRGHEFASLVFPEALAPFAEHPELGNHDFNAAGISFLTRGNQYHPLPNELERNVQTFINHELKETLKKHGIIIIDRIGSGGLAVVYRGWDTVTGEAVAIKVFDQHANSEDVSENEQREFRAESANRQYQILSSLSSRSIPSSHAIIFFKHQPILITELFCDESFSAHKNVEKLRVTFTRDKRNLQNYLLSLETDLTRFLSILESVQHLHNHGIVHGDLKPANILFDSSWAAELVDFDSSFNNTTSSQIKLNIVTELWAAPEVSQGKPQTYLSDIYSLGLVLFLYLIRDEPWCNYDSDTIRNLKLQGPPHIYGRDDTNASAYDIVLKAAQPDPKNRYQTIEEMKAAVEAALAELKSKQSK